MVEAIKDYCSLIIPTREERPCRDADVPSRQGQASSVMGLGSMTRLKEPLKGFAGRQAFRGS